MTGDSQLLALLCKSCCTMTLHKVTGHNPKTCTCRALCMMPHCGAAQDIKMDLLRYAGKRASQ